jgi:hypothetical protein
MVARERFVHQHSLRSEQCLERGERGSIEEIDADNRVEPLRTKWESRNIAYDPKDSRIASNGSHDCAFDEVQCNDRVPCPGERLGVSATSGGDVENERASRQHRKLFDHPAGRRATQLAPAFGVPLIPFGSNVQLATIAHR